VKIENILVETSEVGSNQIIYFILVKVRLR